MMINNNIIIGLFLFFFLLAVILKYNENYSFFGDLKSIFNKARDTKNAFFEDPRKAISSIIKKPPNKPISPIANFINKYADYSVVNIEVCREPVNSLIREFINALSTGILTERMRNKNVKDLFHLYMNVTLLGPNGDINQFTIEKNEIVTIKKPMKEKGDECVHVNLNKEIRFIDFINNGLQMNPSYFWIYNPYEYNCQIFIKNLLDGNGLNTLDLDMFINQNANELLDGLGFTKEISRRITNLAANLKHYFDF